MSEFETWFVLQHGKRTRCISSDENLTDCVHAGRVAKEELRRRQEWDARRQSALYAWMLARRPT